MLAPVTAFYAGLLGLLVIALAVRVVQVRRSEQIDLGDGDNADLFRRIRIHAHAVENIPLALVLLLLLEINGTSATLIHVLGITLVIGRLAHVQGLTSGPGGTPGRVAGNLLTWGVMAIAAFGGIFGC